MLRYLLKRIVFFLPTLFVITLLAFLLSVNSPIDPVDRLVNQQEELAGLSSPQSYSYIQQNRQRIREQFNLHLPVFYFGVASLAEPDTFYRIYDRRQKEALGKLLAGSGNWEAVQAYHTAVEILYRDHAICFAALKELEAEDQKTASDLLAKSLSVTRAMLAVGKAAEIPDRLNTLASLYQGIPLLQPLQDQLSRVQRAFNQVRRDTSRWKNYVPVLIIYGSNNQYHRWIKGILTRLDFGRSYQTGLPISERMGDLLFWSLMFTLVSVVLSYLISLPLGILGAALHGSRFDRISTILVFALDSFPSFVFATLLLVLFANPDVLDWFPASFNVLPAEQQSLWAAFWGDLNRLVLPLIAYTYGQVAYQSRLMRSSMLEVIRQDYIRTARAKGLSERRVLLVHAFRNAALPIITSFAGVFPALIGGHVILETIFSIPGMGREIYRAIFDQDIPMIMAVFTLTGFLSILGYLVSDLLYSWADPRIKLYKA